MKIKPKVICYLVAILFLVGYIYTHSKIYFSPPSNLEPEKTVQLGRKAIPVSSITKVELDPTGPVTTVIIYYKYPEKGHYGMTIMSLEQWNKVKGEAK